MSFYEYIWTDHHGDLHSKTKIEYNNKIADKWVRRVALAILFFIF